MSIVIVFNVLLGVSVRAESECKVTNYFSIDQIFCEKNLIFMKNLFRFQCSRRSFPKASAKLGIIFELTKYFGNFFMLFSIKIFITTDYQAVSSCIF